MRGLLDLLFPPRCAGCRELISSPGPFCPRCRETLSEVPAARCPVCGEPDVAGACDHCLADPPAYERVTAPFLHGGALADAIHRLKYEDRPQLAPALASLLRPALGNELEWCDLVAPISLHPHRLKTRGYDQALLLARALGNGSGRPVVARAIRRVRDTTPQVGKDRSQRRQNVAFAFEGSAEVSGKKVLLVDDVLTTGATAHAAAKACLQAGAVAVRIAALARAG
ncbi:MAG: ComF family protein [Myxococcales bacterium]